MRAEREAKRKIDRGAKTIEVIAKSARSRRGDKKSGRCKRREKVKDGQDEKGGQVEERGNQDAERENRDLMNGAAG